MADAWIDPNYEVPNATNRYLQPSKLDDGSHLIRILDKPTMGEELWSGGKPVRKPGTRPLWTAEELEAGDINKFTGEKRDPVHFWAVPVWNYTAKTIQILHITQKQIQTDLQNLHRNPKWGSPTEYDVSIIKGKDGQMVAYSVVPDPKAKLEKEVKAAWNAVTVDMNEYFVDGGHPIQTSGGTFSEDEVDDIINE